MKFSEATQEVQVHRAHEKPKFSDEVHHPRARRKLASHSDVPAKKLSTEHRPHAPVPIKDIYTLPPFPNITVRIWSCFSFDNFI